MLNRFARVRRSLFETLESRCLLSVSQPNFSNFSSTTGLTANGFGGSSVTQGNVLRITSTLNNLARSVWWNQAVPVEHFTTHFSFIGTNGSNTGDGLTFTLQNGSTAAVGSNGANLGYGGGNLPAQSLAIAFNVYNAGLYGSNFGITSGGTTPVTATSLSPVDLHNSDTYNATITYDGTTLSVTVVDAADSTKTFHTSQAINLPQLLGANDVIVGFTAATGNSVSNQDITEWDYSGTNGPSVVTPAAATPSTTGTKTVALNVLGDDGAGESGLTYTWSTIRKPTGARNPTFSANGTNAAKANQATFYKDGTYRFRATITNALGQSTVSDVTVVVTQTATSLRLAPHAKHLARGSTQKFTAAVLDQFKHAMRTQPTIAWSVASGPGTINKSSGQYSASNTKGHLVIEATDVADDLSGVAGETVV